MAITSVDPRAFAATASDILRASWKPPSLDYSEEYLRWQFGFPTELPPIALTADYEGRPAAFVAATGRITKAGPFYMSSFMSTVPGTPSSVAIAVVRTQCRMLKARGVPTLVFVQSGSVGERLLEVAGLVGLYRTHIGDYRVHSAAPRVQPERSSVRAVSSSEWRRVSEDTSADHVLSLSLDGPTLGHLEADPFNREFLVVERENAQIGSAMLSDTRVASVTGRQSIPTLHCVRLLNGDADALIALLYHARHRGPIVNVPNVFHLPGDTRKAAGLRATPTVFSAYIVGVGTPHALTGTDFEIV